MLDCLGDDRLQYVKSERVQFSQAILDSALDDERARFLFMGHSRGTSDAIAMAASNKVIPLFTSSSIDIQQRWMQDRVDGVVLLNPIGLERHAATRVGSSTWPVDMITWLWKENSWLRFLLNPLLYLCKLDEAAKTTSD